MARELNLKLSLTPKAAPHFNWAVQRHNEALDSGELEGGTVLPFADDSATEKQDYAPNYEVLSTDLGSLVHFLDTVLKEESKQSGQKYPPAAAPLVRELKKLKPAKPKFRRPKAAPVEQQEQKAPETEEAPVVDLSALDDVEVESEGKADEVEPVSEEKTESTSAPVEEEPTIEPDTKEEAKDWAEFMSLLDGVDDDSSLPEFMRNPDKYKPLPEEEKKEEPEVVETQSEPEPEPEGMNPIAKYPTGVMDLTQVENAWDMAIDCVDYPFDVVPLYFQENDDYQEAKGITTSGRDTQFFGVVTDRDRIGEKQVISTVTGLYGVLPPKAAYESLRHELEAMEIPHKPQRVYVSQEGGRQSLTIDIEDRLASNCRDNIKMTVQLITSIDGTKKHHLRLLAHNVDTGTELMGLTSQNFNLTARHTRGVVESHIAFETTITNLIKEWNESIQPMIALMLDSKFDRQFALNMLESVLEEANVPEQHRKNAAAYYDSSVKSKETDHSMYRVVEGMSEYFASSLKDKPERLNEFHDMIAKRSWKMIKTTMAKLAKSKM